MLSRILTTYVRLSDAADAAREAGWVVALYLRHACRRRTR
jgi:hypothetical protein